MKSSSMELTWSAMRCSLRRILPSPARMIFERTDTGAGLLAGRAWDGRFPFDLLSNGHRMRGPGHAGRPGDATAVHRSTGGFKGDNGRAARIVPHRREELRET